MDIIDHRDKIRSIANAVKNGKLMPKKARQLIKDARAKVAIRYLENPPDNCIHCHLSLIIHWCGETQIKRFRCEVLDQVYENNLQRKCTPGDLQKYILENM